MKNNTLKAIYGNRKPDGIYSLTYFVSLLVYYPVSEDEHGMDADFVTAWDYNGKRTDFHRSRVHYLQSGRAYIRKGKSRKIYLDQIIRTDSAWM